MDRLKRLRRKIERETDIEALKKLREYEHYLLSVERIKEKGK